MDDQINVFQWLLQDSQKQWAKDHDEPYPGLDTFLNSFNHFISHVDHELFSIYTVHVSPNGTVWVEWVLKTVDQWDADFRRIEVMRAVEEKAQAIIEALASGVDPDSIVDIQVIHLDDLNDDDE